MFESVIRVHISVIYLHLLYDKLSILQSEVRQEVVQVIVQHHV